MTTALGLEHLGEPHSGESPCGPDLEYEADFIKLGEMIAPPKAGMVASNDDEEEGCDWQEGKALGLGLAAKTRDLRVIVRLCRCLVETDGLEGLGAGISILRVLVESLWDDVHPQLDPDDNMDVTIRLNSLGLMDSPELILALDRALLATTKVGMVATLRDIEIATGKRAAESDDEQSLSAGVVGAAFVEDDPILLMARKHAVDQSLANLTGIVSAWNNSVAALAASRAERELSFDAGESPQFQDLEKKLTYISKQMAERLPKEAQEADSGEVAIGTEVASKAGITNRADAGREIDKIIQWFRHNEPSSPVPVMLARAKSMISMSFLDIVEGLGDSGLNEVRKGAGKSSGLDEE